jgi:redox-sensitive bicupin YhaK (pirin superfamily)
MPLIHDRSLRGHTQTGWLDSRHTFSFGGFNDPGRVGFRSLRVINEDRVIPGAGFGTHDHADMEIVTYVITGALAHKDSLGNGSIIRPGEIQRMSAGTGISHSELNASEDEPVHFLQIWIIPGRMGIPPSYEQKTIDTESARRGFALVADRQGGEHAVSVSQDVSIYVAKPRDRESVSYGLSAGRGGFLQIVDGTVRIGDEILYAGDGLEFEATGECAIAAEADSELLLFDLA